MKKKCEPYCPPGGVKFRRRKDGAVSTKCSYCGAGGVFSRGEVRINLQMLRTLRQEDREHDDIWD